jgi:hypothetical protein
MQAVETAKNAGFSWRRRPAGGFSHRHTLQNRRRDAGATKHRASIRRISFEREETKKY